MADEIELKTAPADFRFPTTNQTRHCFTRAWLQKENLMNVRDLPNTIFLFVLVNGLRGGVSRGRMVLSQVLCDCTLKIR
ncbi:uncharacterized protein LOC105780564 isoform X1 [Gossypium raimondii]|uniref:uncharacterized protein LOC105780564 isoform X1 n=1 Tax=Gossypium raimondii TaxID=29730 RepID=UPI00227BEC47|nr:uncharacterized protein LOC105780564 isoform X1 [Gossypium raimondii]